MKYRKVSNVDGGENDYDQARQEEPTIASKQSGQIISNYTTTNDCKSTCCPNFD